MRTLVPNCGLNGSPSFSSHPLPRISCIALSRGTTHFFATNSREISTIAPVFSKEL